MHYGGFSSVSNAASSETHGHTSSALEVQKESLKGMCSNPIARLSNAGARMENLKRNADTIMPSEDKEKFIDLITRFQQYIDEQRYLLQGARDSIDSIAVVPPPEETDNTHE